MYISKVQINNYMAFRDSGEINLKPGFNIVIGKNNVGKTAFLKALSLNFNDDRHIDVLSIENSIHRSSVNITFSLNKNVVLKLVTTNENSIVLPKPSNSKTDEAIEKFIKWLHNDYPVEPTYTVYPAGKPESSSRMFGLYNIPPQPHFMIADIQDDVYKYKATIDDRRNIIEMDLFSKIKNSIYLFNTEKHLIGPSELNTTTKLNNDISNLPTVINNIVSNPFKFQEYNHYVTKILPNVKAVTTKPIDTQKIEIRVWSIDPKTQREDLAIPLQKCGTGVGQVLALLYVVFNSKDPQIIVIDEPQSFLHPSALRNLMNVLREFSQHQYIIATHSPMIISATHPSTVTTILHDGNEASVSQIDYKDINHIRSLFSELGVRFSDLFGAEKTLWVEGPTEKTCFPVILTKVAPQSLQGVDIQAVASTGEFNRRQASLTFDLYKRISEGNALFPPAVGFLFDREGLKATDITDIQREAPRPVDFLPRRMYENYILDPDAIAHVLTQEMEVDGEPKNTISPNQIEVWISKRRQKEMPDITDIEWFVKVDGAKLLKELFRDLTGKTIEFSKTRHSTLITEWIMENKPEFLKELSDFLVNFITQSLKQ